MILRSTPTFLGTLLWALVVLTTCQYYLVLGQAETESDPTQYTVSTPDSSEDGILALAQEDDDACPCILKVNCPRVYGSNPLDFTEIGHFEPCKEDGLVRCCGVSVTVVEAKDEVPEYDDESSWEMNESDQEPEETFPASSTSEVTENKEEVENDGAGEDREDQSHEQQGQLSQKEGEPEKEVKVSENHDESGGQKEDEEHKSVSEDKETDDLLTSASNQESSYTVIVQPPPPAAGESSRKRFQPKFPRYGRPGKSPSVLVGSDNDDNSGNNDSNDKTSLEEGKKETVNSNSNNPSYGGSGNVVYSQRVTEFSPYRRRNNVNTAPVFTITPSDSPNDSKENRMESDNAPVITANRVDRPKYQMRRRKPFNQMRNRPEETVKVNDADIESNDKKPESGEIYGTSPSPDLSSPAPLHVSGTEETPAWEGDENGLDNQRRPMSRLGRPRVNGLKRRKPTDTVGPTTSAVDSKLAEQDESSYSNNSYGSTPTLENVATQEKSSQHEEVSGTGPTLDENNNKATTIITGSAVKEDESSSAYSSPSSSAKSYENSPTGKLIPVRPAIRPFTPKKADQISADTTYPQTSSSSVSSTLPVNQDEGQEVSSSPLNSYDPIKSSEPTQLKGNGVYIRKVPMRKVRPSADVEKPKGEDEEDSYNANSHEQVETSLPNNGPPSRGRIIMRRPINSASSASLQMKNVNSPESSSSTEDKIGETDNVEKQEAPPAKIEKLDIRKKLLAGRNRKNPLKTGASAAATITVEDSNDKVEVTEEPLKASSNEPNRPNILRRRRPLRKPQGQTGSGSSESSEKETESTDSSITNEEKPATDLSAEKSPIKIRRGPHRLLRRPQQEKAIDSGNAQSEQNEDSSAPTTANEETSKPILLRQRNRMSSNNRAKVRNPLLPSSSADHSSTTSTATASEDSHTSEAPVTVTSTYSRIRINNNKNGMVARPTYRKPVKSSPAPATETLENSIHSPDASTSHSNSFTSGRKPGYGGRFRVRVEQTSQAPLKVEDTESPSSSLSNEEKAEGSQVVSKSGQLNENPIEEENVTEPPPKRRRFGQRKRVRVSKPQEQEQEQPEIQQNYNSQQHEAEPSSTIQEEMKQQEQNPVGAVDDINPPRQDSEHVISSSEEPITTHYPHPPSNMVKGDDDVKQEEQSEDQSPSQLLPGNFSTSYHDTSSSAISSTLETGESDIGYDNTKKDDANSDELEDKKVYLNYPNSGAMRENEPYDLILNQDVRKHLGILSTHHEATSYQTHDDGEHLVNEDNLAGSHHQSSHESHPSSSLNQNHDDQQYLHQQHQQQPHSTYYDPYYYDQFGHDNNNAIHNSHPEPELNKYTMPGHEDNQHESVSPTRAQHYYSSSSGADGLGGFETIEIGTPDYGYDASPYDSWYMYGEGQEDEEESRVSMKFLKEKSSENKSSQLIPTNPTSEGSSGEIGGSNNNNSNNNRDNEGNPVDISRVKVGPSRVIQRTVNRVNANENASSSPSKNHDNNNERPDSVNRNNVNIRKDANLRIRQKLRRPPSAYINSSVQPQDSVPVPTTRAPFTPSLQSPRPTYSGQEALVESMNESVHSLPKLENASSSSSTTKSSSYPNPDQLEQFIQHKQQITPGERKNRTRVRIKMVTLKTTPAAVAQTDENDMSLNVNANVNENEKNGSPDALSSSQGGGVKRPYSAFTFPPFKKSELTLISTSTEVPLEDDAPAPYSYSPPILPPFKSTVATTTTAPLLPALSKKPLRSSYNGNFKQESSSSSSSELPKTSAQISGADRHVPKVNTFKPSANGRFKVRERNQTTNAVTPTLPPTSSSASSFKDHQAPSTSSLPSTDVIRSTRRPQPRIKSPPYVRKHGSIPTTEAPIIRQEQQLPEATNPPPAYSNVEDEKEIHIEFREEVPTSSPHIIQHQLVPEEQSYDNIKPVPLVPQKETEPVSIRIQTPQLNDITEYDVHNGVHDTNKVSTYHHKSVAAPHPPYKVSGKEGYTENKSSGQKGKYQRFKVPEKFNLPKPTDSPITIPKRENDYYYNNRDEYQGQTVPPSVEYDHVKVHFTEEPAIQTQSPSLEVTTAQYQPEPPHVFNENTYDNGPLPMENSLKLESQNENYPVEEPIRLAALEPEVVPDIRINVIQPEPQAPLMEHEERPFPPRPLYHAIREPETFHHVPPHGQPLYTDALRNSPFGPFPSTDHWSGIPSPNSPRLPEYFQQNRGPNPNQQPPPVEFAEPSREQARLPPPPPPQVPEFFEQNRHPNQQPQPIVHAEPPREISRPPLPPVPEFFEQNRVPQQPHRQQQPPPFRHPPHSNVIFEQNRDVIRQPQQPRPLESVVISRPQERPIRFEEEEEEEEEDQLELSNPPPPVQETSIRFGTSIQGNDDERNPLQPPFPQRPLLPINNNDVRIHDSHHPPIDPPPPHFSGNRDVPFQMPPARPPPPPLPLENMQNRPIQLPLPPQSINPPLPHMEVMNPPPPPPLRNQNELPLSPQPLPPTEVQAEPILKLQPGSQEPIPHGVIHNPVPLKTVSYEINNGELKKPHYETGDVTAIQQPNANLPHLRQHQQQFPIRQQNPDLHLTDIPFGNQQQQPMRLPPPMQQQRPELMNRFPPHSQRPNEAGNILHSEGNRDVPLRPNNIQFPTPNNILVQVDGKPHDATPLNNGNNLQKPLDRPGGHVFFEKEPELRVPSQAGNGPIPSQDNKFPILNFESHQMPNAREPTSKPLIFPQQQQQQPAQIRFPESNNNMQGFPERLPSRPGQFGPPPPSQQSQPQYVPFGPGGERLKMNETQKPVIENLQNRPPIMPPPPQMYSHPVKYGGMQSPSPYNPRPQPPRQHHGFMNPMQSYPPNRRPPAPQMMMPGYPRGQYENNPYFQQRMRNPNARTSRAANLTAEEEKALANEQGLFQPTLPGNDEQESLADQQAILFLEKESSSEEMREKQDDHDHDHSSNEQNDASQVAPEDDKKSSSNIQSQRQQRELNLDTASSSLQDKTSQSDLLGMHNNRDVIAEKEDAINESELAESQVAEKVKKADGIHPIHSNSRESNKPEGEGSEDPLKLSKRKKFVEHKEKHESILNDDNGRASSSSSPTFQSTSASSSEPRKSYKGKISDAPEKSEDIHQISGKMKGSNKDEQGQAPMLTIGALNPDEIQEQQEFVAPTVIQRGFHPILPYSEKDPGPILVQMMPKVEKFLPPSTASDVGGAALFQLIPTPSQTQGTKGKSIISSSSSSSSYPSVVPLSQDSFLSKQLNSNNHLAVLQTNTLSNNQTPFNTLTSNHLTTGSV